MITVDNSSGRVNADLLGSSATKGLRTVKYRDVYDDGRNRMNPLLRPGERLDPEDIVNIQFTSGLVAYSWVPGFSSSPPSLHREGERKIDLKTC